MDPALIVRVSRLVVRGLTMDYELSWFNRAIIAYKIKQRDAKSPGEKPGVKVKCERHFEINDEYWRDYD
jgi:hypothetical protein